MNITITYVEIMAALLLPVYVFLLVSAWRKRYIEKTCSEYFSVIHGGIHWSHVYKAKCEKYGDNLYNEHIHGVLFEYFEDIDTLVMYDEFCGYRIYRRG